jgi:hypothetical protein
MKDLPPLPSPGGFERAYAESYELAFKKLRQADLADVCLKSGGLPIDADRIRLHFLDRDYLVDRIQGSVSLIPDTEPVPIAEKLLILHYLLTAQGAPLRGEAVSFKELPDGIGYYPTFYKRAIRPLIDKFGASPADLITAAAKVGGVETPGGDAAVSVQAFPKVAVTWALWRGDDEFPPEGTIIVDRSVQDYLPTEDFVVLCQLIAIKLCRGV